MHKLEEEKSQLVYEMSDAQMSKDEQAHERTRLNNQVRGFVPVVASLCPNVSTIESGFHMSVKVCSLSFPFTLYHQLLLYFCFLHMIV